GERSRPTGRAPSLASEIDHWPAPQPSSRMSFPATSPRTLSSASGICQTPQASPAFSASCSPWRFWYASLWRSQKARFLAAWRERDARLLAGLDDRDCPAATAGLELDDAGASGEDRVVAAEAGAVPWAEAGAALAHDDLAAA